uniref:Endonuclease/exonuclease/phosphatase domain-containing protein n=1 Tax=Anguilla anguilla TaxID=7936 RepID=A0A0E9PP31_ANGAN
MTNTNSQNSDTGSCIRFFSCNVKGMNSPVKRSKVFSHLKSLNADIVFIQETHLRDRDQMGG